MSTPYAYVWDWWDGTSEATTTPTTSKRINVGGQPGTSLLFYRCTPVLEDGQSVTLIGTTSANNPPTVVPPVVVSNNDDYFPYNTQITVKAFDFDGDAFAFSWYSGTSYLGAGASTAVAATTGTWTGNGTTVVAVYPTTQNVFSTTVASARTVSAYLVDTQNGTTRLDFDLRGFVRPPPSAGFSALPSGVSVNASSVAEARIGVGQNIAFSVYAKDETGGTVAFLWTFVGSNGWTSGPVYTTGATLATADGGYSNTYTKDISSEVVSTGTEKFSTAVVRATTSASHVDLPFTVKLIANAVPSAINVTVTNNGNPYDITTLSPVAAGCKLEYSAEGVDANGDVLVYRWDFAPPVNVTFFGGKVVIDTTGLSTLNLVQGSVTATDRMGATYTVSLPIIPIA